jgi:predicted transposase YdaD
MVNVPKTLRGTDEIFFQLMQLSGKALLKLLGFPPEVAENYEFRAVEFKEKRLQKPDIEGLPILETENNRIVIEFQGYRDKYIRFRTLSNMLQVCMKSETDNPIIGIIIYTQQQYQDVALPLEQLLDGKIRLIEKVLTDYSESELLSADERLIILAPFTVPSDLDKLELKQKIQNWGKKIYDIYPDNEQRQEAIDIIGLFLLSRFRKLHHEEVIDMLNLDLMNTQAGQDIYHMGELKGELRAELRGERAIFIRLLRKRFGELSNSVQNNIDNATLSQLEQWSLNILDAKNLDDVFQNLDN